MEERKIFQVFFELDGNTFDVRVPSKMESDALDTVLHLLTSDACGRINCSRMQITEVF